MAKLPEINLDDLDSWDSQSEAPASSKSSKRQSMRRLASSTETAGRKKDSKYDDTMSESAKSESSSSKADKRKSSRMSRRFDEPIADESSEKKKPKGNKTTSGAADFAKALTTPVKSVFSYGAAAGHAIGHFASGIASPMLKKCVLIRIDSVSSTSKLPQNPTFFLVFLLSFPLVSGVDLRKIDDIGPNFFQHSFSCQFSRTNTTHFDS